MEKEKMKYVSPSIEVILMECESVIANSYGPNQGQLPEMGDGGSAIE